MRTLMNDNRAVPTVQLDNDHLRVTEWRFGPGAATGYHRHAHDYVVVPVLDGELELIGPDGRRARVRLQQGKSYFRNAGVEHDVSMPAPASWPSSKSNLRTPVDRWKLFVGVNSETERLPSLGQIRST